MPEPMPSLIFQSTRELQQALFDIMADGVLVIDREGTILDCNPAFHQRLGYRKSEVIGHNIAELNPREFAVEVPERIALVLRQGQSTFESAHCRKDGSIMPVELSVRRVEIGGKEAMFSVARQISERQNWQARFREGFKVCKTAINTPPLGFWVTDSQGRFLEVNDAYLKQSGYGRAELLELAIADVEALETPEETAAHIRCVVAEGFGRFRTEHRRKDGSTWPVEVVATYSKLRGGRLFVYIEDLTEKVAQEERLALAARVFETMEQAVVITDAANRIVSINPAAARIGGYTLEEVQGKDPKIFASGRHDNAFYAAMWESLNTLGHWEGEIWDRRKNGEVYAKWLTINTIRDAHGTLKQYFSVFTDITERKKTEELIWKQANFDALTGLPNRQLMLERLEQEIKKAQRSGHPLALLFIDLDRFKEVNDNLGHAKGDLLLVQAGRRIQSDVRDTDTVARLGGDEFTVLLPDFSTQASVERIAQALIHDLAEPFNLGDDDVAYVSASIGITLYPADAGDPDGLLKQADQAMYVAKAEGRNRFGYFTASMQQAAQKKLALSNDLRLALAQGQMQIHYQPIVDLNGGGIVKAEALLRWDHPHLGLVSPEVFIPIAEETGLIYDLGEWVFIFTIDRIRRWQQRCGRIIQVSVNKSAVQLQKSTTTNWMNKLAALGLPSKSITVEITESLLLSKSQQIRQRLIEFRQAGIEVSIDDFGTGFSALSSLHKSEIDYLKIDRSLVSRLTENAADTALIEAIIVMAHKLGLKAIAEGVETAPQRDLLKGFGCDYAQGYFYSRPLPADEFEQLVAAGESLA